MTERQYVLTLLAAQLIRMLILIPFLRNLRGLLRNVGEKNRAMRPDLVWLNLIPVLDFAWILVTLIKVRDSLRAESATHGQGATGESAFKVGLYSWICYVSVFVLQLVVLVSAFENAALVYVVDILGLGYLGLWIAYWAKTAAIKTRMAQVSGVLSPGPAPVGARRACASCGSPAWPGDDYCRRCGAAVDAGPVGGPVAEVDEAEVGEGAETPTTDSACPFCGAEYRPNAQFCSVCGRPAV